MMLAVRESPGLPTTLAQSLNELPFGSNSQVQTADGKIAAFLAYAGFDRRSGTAKYALRILNNTPFAARAVLCVESRGAQISAYPRDFTVAPFSMRDDMVPVRMDITGPFDRAIVCVRSEAAEFSVEAPAPGRDGVRWPRFVLAALLPVVLFGAAQLSAPRVLALDAPPKALAGGTLQVFYQTFGLGRARYDFSTHDGVQIAAGVAGNAGELRLPIPARGAGAPYTLRLRMQDPVRFAERTATIAAIVPAAAAAAPAKHAQAPGAPSIADLSLSPSPVRAGSDLRVRYAADADNGTVTLLDQYGRVWAQTPLLASGVSVLAVPQAAAGRDMRVVLDARRGTGNAQSSVGVSVLASAAAAEPEQTAPSSPPSPGAAKLQLSIDSQVVSAGDTVTIRAGGKHGDIKINLTGASGQIVSQGDISEDDDAISIAAPSVREVTTFYVVASSTQGVSQQSSVLRLVVTPR